jgi:hypothetical protein
MILPRAHLALSYLDLFSANDLPCSSTNRLVHVLVRNPEHLCVNVPCVLIARSESTDVVYVMDRHDAGGSLYVVCRLGKWVNVMELRSKAVACSTRLRDRKKRSGEGVIGDEDEHRAVAMTPAVHRAQKKKKVAIEEFRSLVKRRARSQSVVAASRDQRTESQGSGDAGDQTGNDAGNDIKNDTGTDIKNGTGTDTNNDTQHLSEPTAAPPKEQPPPPGPDELLENIRTQYLETLYKSMVGSVPPPSPTYCSSG